MRKSAIGELAKSIPGRRRCGERKCCRTGSSLIELSQTVSLCDAEAHNPSERQPMRASSHGIRPRRRPEGALIAAALLIVGPAIERADSPPRIDVAGQPLAANVRRVLDALELLGQPLN